MARLSCNFLFIILVVFPVPWMELRAEAKICYNIIPNIVPCNLGGCQRLCKFLHYEKGECSPMLPSGEIRCKCSWTYKCPEGARDKRSQDLRQVILGSSEGYVVFVKMIDHPDLEKDLSTFAR
ncbi:hypothetical protein DKX38_000305 [Salix brachista]|uniref:Uncharacterized protein n=1 Tax=Salix brachista TaxID=2182728 RepID=A0A5N5P2T8_9ROSI|nr:hypothetical protein DKX38_000305 [Salix brachista]